MIRLLRIELRRMWHRRLPWVLLLGITVAMIIGGVVTFVSHDATAPTPGDVSAEIEAQVADCRRFTTEEWNAWDQGELGDTDPEYERYLGSFDSAEAMADDQCNPRYFDGEFLNDPRFCLISLYEPGVEFREGCPDLEEANVYERQSGTIVVDGTQYRALRSNTSGTVSDVSLFLFIVASVIGASFIGAEYKAGTIETTLLWEPRRGRVLGAKVGAAAITALIIHMAALVLLVAVVVPSAVWRGSTAGVDSAFWFGLGGVILRGGVVAAALAVMAFSVSVVTRNTVGGVVVMLGYGVVSPTISFLLLRSLRPFELTENLTAFAVDGEVGRFVGSGFDVMSVYSHGVTGAAVRIAAYVTIAVAIALVVFRRRDID